MILDQETVTRLRGALVSRAGGYLRNPMRQDRVTCAVCTTPVNGYERCFTCNAHYGRQGLADATAFLTYAVAGQQSGYVMYGYKAPRPVREHITIVTLMILLALAIHEQCPGTLAGAPVTHWAVVPSLPAKPGEHPMHRIIRNIAPGREAKLTAACSPQRPREVNQDHFSADPFPSRSHVLLMDDTWASGGHAQSAALALRRAGAARVSVLVVARWIREDFGDNAKFLRDLAGHDYNPEICPWTGGSCPWAMSVLRSP